MSHTNSQLPRLPLRFFRWFCHPDLAKYIEGDLIELFEERVAQSGKRKAKWLFIWDVLQLFRPGIIRPAEGIYRLNQYDMFQNHLKSAWRNLLKRKRFSALNIAGLSIGMASCLLILQYVRFEKSYDQFHPELENLYRLTLDMNKNGNSSENFMATNHPAAGPAMKADFPQVIEFARLLKESNLTPNVYSYRTADGHIKTFYEDRTYIVDPSFLRIFNYPFIVGDTETALNDPNCAVISQDIALKYFGNLNPIGKILTINHSLKMKITGVMKNMPENSHLKADILLSFRSLENNTPEINSKWKEPGFYTYLKVASGTDIENLESQLDGFADKYLGDVMEEFGIEERMHLQPVADIHLQSHLKKEVEKNGSYESVAFLMLIAILILLIAWVNYVNLSTSRSIERAAEVGIRKVVGASKGSLISQFYIESTIINLLAIVLALILVEVAAPGFNALIGKQFFSGIMNMHFWSEGSNWLILFATVVVGSLLAGFYPALVLSSFKPVKIFNGYNSKKKPSFRSVLVVFQFCISFILIVGTLIVFSQLRYMKSQELGFNMDKMLVIKSPKTADSTFLIKTKLLSEELLKGTSINSFAPSSDIPGHRVADVNSIKKKGQQNEEGFMVSSLYVDEYFLPTYEMKLVAGRNFSKDLATDKDKVIINEKSVELLGFRSAQKAIGQMASITFSGRWVDTKIIGVCENINNQSLVHEQRPMVFPYMKPWSGWSGANYFNLKIKANDLQSTIAKTENVFKEIFPNDPFVYFFLDDHFNEQYKSDQQFGKIFGIFTSLAIIVACLGLFGLVSYVSSTRTKEIGIRKVMGASTMQILTLLSKQFVKLLIIAAILAVPISWWGGDTWLSNYAYRIEIDGWLFATATLIVFSIALFTVLWQSISTANANPVDSLRDE
jgi:putative ABC transport system permease protein